jgi:hypothetical protein
VLILSFGNVTVNDSIIIIKKFVKP